MDVRILPFEDMKDYGPLEKKLGQGTYGAVYKLKNKLNLAIKLSEFDEGIKESELREVVLLKNMSHPNIVPIIDVIFTKNKLGIVLPLADGTLDQSIEVNKRNIEVTRTYAHDLANGVAYMTSKDIIHRDLKPNNVLFKKNEQGYVRLWITDFGLSRIGKCSDLTFSKEVYTLWYRPPEILLGAKYDHSADVWALGCIIAEIYIGKPLFPGMSEYEMLIKMFKLLGTPTEETWQGAKDLPNWKAFPQYPETINASMFGDDKELTSLIKRCLTLNPAKRIGIMDVVNDKFFDKIRGAFDTFDKTNFFYMPEPESLSCNNRYEEIMIYTFLDSFRDRPKIKYIEVNRAVVIDYLLKLVQGLRLDKKMLGLVVYMMDEYISRYEKYNSDALQEISLTILSIVCKFYGSPISMYDLAKLAQAKDENILKIEQEILKELNFDLMVSTVADFLSLYTSFYEDNVAIIAWQLYKYSLLTHLCFDYNAQQIALALLLMAVVFENTTFKHSKYLTEEVFQIPRRFFKDMRELRKNKLITLIDFDTDIVTLEKEKQKTMSGAWKIPTKKFCSFRNLEKAVYGNKLKVL